MNKDKSNESYAKSPLEESPLIMYLVVRESLNMSIGKTAAQTGHAVGVLYNRFLLNRDYVTHIEDLMDGPCYGPISVDQNKSINYDLFNKWQKSGHRKVVLKADEKEWIQLKDLPDYVLIIDAGFTELDPNTETVIGFYPMYKDQAPKIIKRLQLLK